MSPVPHLVLWGTNPRGGWAQRYGQRVHVVWAADPRRALCGLPVTYRWELRPPSTTLPVFAPAGAEALRLCPECCLLAMAALFPADPGHEPAEPLTDHLLADTPETDLPRSNP